MELLKLTDEASYASRWDGAATIAYLQILKQDLCDCYDFINVVDDLKIDSGDGSSSIAWSGSIRLYIDNSAYLLLNLYKYSNSYSIGIKITIVNISGSTDLYYKGATSDVSYYKHAIWKTETNQIIVSCAISPTLSSVTPLTKGLTFMIGTATNQYTNNNIPTLLGFIQTSVTNVNTFKNSGGETNKLIMANEKLRDATVVSLPTNSSNIAALAPIVSPNNHYVMDNILCSTLVPSCFSDSYSTIEYKDHTYAQFGRFLLLDEDVE